MKQLTSAQIRQMWLDFWKSKGHAVEPSANLVPVNDPTLLWINSGVATLKKYFDGSVIPENPRITNSQRLSVPTISKMLVRQLVTTQCLKCLVTSQLVTTSVMKPSNGVMSF